jgi:hypothetical protein
MSDRPMHTLHIVTTYNDGHVDKHAYERQGEAQAAHDALAARWKSAGATFTRDRRARTLTRGYSITHEGESLNYVDQITHIAWEDR